METIKDVVQLLSTFVIILVIFGFPLYGIIKKVPVYEASAGLQDILSSERSIGPALVEMLQRSGFDVQHEQRERGERGRDEDECGGVNASTVVCNRTRTG